MEPHIDATRFGSITLAGETFQHDIVIRLDGKIEKRKKKLSRRQSGTSHIVSSDEAKHLFDEGAERLIVGSGQFGALRVSEAAEHYFKEQGCSVELYPTPEAIGVWNAADGKTIAMFHVTC